MAYSYMLLPQMQITGTYVQTGADAIDVSDAGRVAFQFFVEGIQGGDATEVAFFLETATSKSDDQFITDAAPSATLEVGTETAIHVLAGDFGQYGAFIKLRVVPNFGVSTSVVTVRCQVNLMDMGS